MAVLGPTNTGKTYLAIERMLGHPTGMIGLPLRLLAREVYGRVVERVGPKAVALITGEEKIRPERARYWICTLEAMPRDLDVSFVAIDEVQLAADFDRGHVFTERLLNHRGLDETLIIGANTMRPLIESLIPGVSVTTRPRLSHLAFAGGKKVSRLPARSAIVAFSAEEVYAIAEFVRRQRGGAAVVLGALSPRTRNAQVELYQAGEVDYIVATDAIGMGLNLDVHHVAFASRKKFDGFRYRNLVPAELAQIAGRAGRHLTDGTFGSSSRCEPFDAETVDALENHRFEPVRVAQWRNPDLEFGSLAALAGSLAVTPQERGLTRALVAADEAALQFLVKDDDIRRLARGRAAVERLWQTCQIPDYRKVSPNSHADLVSQIYRFLMEDRHIRTDWFARHVAMVDRTDGDIDALSQRIAHVRTWTFVANRPDWLADPEHWQAETRRVEDTLSDALHERLASRFVDRRTSVLMRRLRENAIMEAEINSGGDVTVEGQHVGQLHGFQFVPDPGATGTEAQALRNAAAKALASEIEARAERFAAAPDATLVLSNDGTVRWTGEPVAKLEPSDKVFDPALRILADEQLTGPARDKVDARLKAWLKAHVVRLLGPLLELEGAAEVTGLARGIGFQVAEALGILERSRVAQDLRSLDQAGRAALRAKGVRFGAYHVYMPALIKPAPRILAAQLFALKNGGLDQKGIDELAHLAGSGRTSFAVDPEIARGLYRAAGFRVCGARAVRIDILERLADLIRPAVSYRPGVTAGDPPPGTADGEGFVQTPAMTSLVGTSGEDFGSILKSLGYVGETRTGPAITVPLVPARPRAATVPAAVAADAAAGDTAASGEPAAAEVAESGGVAPVPTEPVAPIPDDGQLDTTTIEERPLTPYVEPDDADAADEPDPTVQEAADPAPDAGLVAPALEDAADRLLAEAGPDAASDESDDADASDEPDPGIQDEVAGSIIESVAQEEHLPRPHAEVAGAAGPRSTRDGGVSFEAELRPAPQDEEVGETGPDPDVSLDDIVIPPEAAIAVEDEAPTPTLFAEGEMAAGAGVTSPIEDVATMLSEDGTAVPDAAVSDTTAVPETIEVWHLQRGGRDQRQNRPARGRDARRGPPGAQAGRPPQSGERPDQRRAGGGRERFGGSLATADERRGLRAAGPEGRRDGPPRPDNGRGDTRRTDAKRPDRRGPERGRGERPSFSERPPERRERAPDPNSPFAALAALKAQLEGRDKPS